MSDVGIQTIDFMKVDIEGGEYDVFDAPDWLDCVSILAIEVHQPDYQKAVLFETLQRAGFRAFCVDTRRRRVAPDCAEYIFAARDPDVFALKV